MNRKVKYYISKLLLPAISLGLFIYFSYHLITGDRGFLVMRKLRESFETSSKELTELTKKQDHIENKVSLLRTKSIDPDMLDEQARKILGYGENDEIILID